MIDASPLRVRPVILSGGSGTRLWPLSRAERPKQLLSLVESITMLQSTAGRVGDGARFAPPLVVANERHSAAILDQLSEKGAEVRMILEPCARNTAPAIALAALVALSEDPATPLLVMPSDHVIGDVAAFHNAIEVAVPAVDAGWLVTFGIAPDAPETGYGYIRQGEPLMAGVERVEAFIEKPTRDKAAEYVASGRYAWNGGIFMFRADKYIEALNEFQPEVIAACREAVSGATTQGNIVSIDAAAFAASPSISVDYAVMERSDRVAVVPVAMDWSDVGSWDALYDLSTRDDADNRVEGDVVAIDTAGCFIRTDGPVVAAVGVSDLTIVASEDAVLIMRRGESQGIKRAVEVLKDRDHSTLDRRSRLSHGWGVERRICSGDGATVSLIEVAPGCRTPELLAATTCRFERVGGAGLIEGEGELEIAIDVPAGQAVALVNLHKVPFQVLRTVRSA